LSFLSQVDSLLLSQFIQHILGVEEHRISVEPKQDTYHKVAPTATDINENKEYYHYSTEQMIEMMVQTQMVDDGLQVPEFNQELSESAYFTETHQDNASIDKTNLELADPMFTGGQTLYDLIPAIDSTKIHSYRINIFPDFDDDGPSPLSAAQYLASKSLSIKKKFPSYLDLQDPENTIIESDTPIQSFHTNPMVSEISAFFAVFKFGISIPGNVYGIVLNRDRGTPEPFQVRLGTDPENYILRDGHRLAVDVTQADLLNQTHQRFNFTLLEHSTRYSAYFVASTASDLREDFRGAADGDIYRVDFMTKVEVFHVTSQMEFLDIEVEQV
jgi:hypothetical protein